MYCLWLSLAGELTGFLDNIRSSRKVSVRELPIGVDFIRNSRSCAEALQDNFLWQYEKKDFMLSRHPVRCLYGICRYQKADSVLQLHGMTDCNL